MLTSAKKIGKFSLNNCISLIVLQNTIILPSFMTLSLSNPDKLAKHGLTCLFKAKKGEQKLRNTPLYVCSHKKISPKATQGGF